MTTSTVNPNPAARPLFAPPPTARRLAIACAFFCAGLIAQSAGAQYVGQSGNLQQATPYQTSQRALVNHSKPYTMTANHVNRCPPGEQRSQDGRCRAVPQRPQKAAQQTPHQPRYMEKLNTTQYAANPVGGSHLHKTKPEIIDRAKVKPQPGGPIEHGSSASERQGIIFVGGHSSSRLDKAALNPQPIPPGRSLRKTPQPGAPIEGSGH